MKATNTEHTAINGNQSKCRMTQSLFGWRIDEVRKRILDGGDFGQG